MAMAVIPSLAYGQTPAPEQPSATAEIPKSTAQAAPFSLKPGEALVISENGAISFVSRLGGDPAYIREMRRKSRSLPKGLVLWADLDGQVYATEPIQRSPSDRDRKIEPKPVKESAKPAAQDVEKKHRACNIRLCASTFASFRAADCSYQPIGGGSRRLCEFN